MPKKKKGGVAGPHRKYHYLPKTKRESSVNFKAESDTESVRTPESSGNIYPESNFDNLSLQTVQNEVIDVNVQTIPIEVADVNVQTIIQANDMCTQTIENESDHTYAKSFSDYSCEDSSNTISTEHTCYSFGNEIHEDKEQVNIELSDEIVESLSFSEFSSDIKNGLGNKSYCVLETVNDLTLVDFYRDSGSALAVKLTVKFDKEFRCNVSVHRRDIPKSHSLWEGAPEVFHDSKDALCFLERLERFSVCSGNPEEQFQHLVPVGSGLTNSSSTDIVAYREGNFGASYQSTIRSCACDVLTLRKGKCMKCRDYGYALTKRHKRLEERKLGTRKFSHSTFKHSDMTREELCYKLSEQKNEINDLSNQVWKLKRQFEQSINKNGVKVNDYENTELKTLFATCSEEVKQSFPDSNSRQRLFWEQQELCANKSDKRGMRWHPMIIRWCLFMRHKSQVAYDAMRESGFINLPSSRTLYDYSHFLKSELGFQSDVFQLAKTEAQKNGLYDAEWRKNVGLLFDEIKIREDLVYDKQTGELIGYCNLGDIANQMMAFDVSHADTGQEMAKHVLVVMMRSVYGRLCFPLCAFATKSITADYLYPILWQTVSIVQTQLDLRVLFFTCDGASPNRRFFHLHRVGNEQFIFRTVNPNYRNRHIYFISDVPHLVKTLRNNLSNSFSHNKSRTLWRNHKDISWMHIVKLFEDHCEINLYNPCPKLTRKHIHLTSFNYMKVKLASQVLSESVANAMADLYGPETEETVKFLKIFNKFFDCLNVRSRWEGRNTRNPNVEPYRDVNDTRFEFLTGELMDYLRLWQEEVDNRPGNFTKAQRASMILSYQTLEGVRLSARSISACVRLLLNEGADFVMTHCFNQDPLEQHFGHYRHKCGGNNNPSVYEVRNTLTTIRAVNSQGLAPKRGNTDRGRVDNFSIDNSKTPRRK